MIHRHCRTRSRYSSRPRCRIIPCQLHLCRTEEHRGDERQRGSEVTTKEGNRLGYKGNEKGKDLREEGNRLGYEGNEKGKDLEEEGNAIFGSG